MHHVLVAAVYHEPIDDAEDENRPEGAFMQIPVKAAEAEFVVGFSNNIETMVPNRAH